jgi:hypothetical protein
MQKICRQQNQSHTIQDKSIDHACDRFFHRDSGPTVKSRFGSGRPNCSGSLVEVMKQFLGRTVHTVKNIPSSPSLQTRKADVFRASAFRLV